MATTSLTGQKLLREYSFGSTRQPRMARAVIVVVFHGFMMGSSVLCVFNLRAGKGSDFVSTPGLANNIGMGAFSNISHRLMNQACSFRNRRDLSMKAVLIPCYRPVHRRGISPDGFRFTFGFLTICLATCGKSFRPVFGSNIAVVCIDGCLRLRSRKNVCNPHGIQAG